MLTNSNPIAGLAGSTLVVVVVVVFVSEFETWTQQP